MVSHLGIHMALQKRTRSQALVGLIALGTLAAVGLATVHSLRAAPRNVVLVVIDTLRADHLGAYGYMRATSPFLDELAARSVLFEDAVSAASVTFPSVNSLLTSLPPDFFSNKVMQDLRIPEEATTLAEVFSRNGFRTGAVSASPIVRRSPSRVNPQGGFGRGFEQFDESCCPRDGLLPHSSQCVTRAALRMLSSFDKARFFLYVHYLDPHDPYQPPPRWNRFAQPYKGDKLFLVQGVTNTISDWLYERGDDPHVTSGDIQHLIDLYDGEVLAVDAALRQLFEGFARQGRLDDTLFVLTADHGESFMEHNHIQHGRSVYQTELHVPLIFHWRARWKRGLRRQEPVCSIDIMPSILRLVGLPVPEAARGVPLLSAWPWGVAPSRRVCLSEGRLSWRVPYGNPVSARLGSYKIIYDRTRDVYEAFDLAGDPQELKNLASPDRAAAGARFLAMQRDLASWFRPPAVQRPGCGQPVKLDPEVQRALKALGYVH